MKQPYKFKRDTGRYTKGEVVDFVPTNIKTRQRLERGIIEAVQPAKKREKKVVEPDEVKDNDSQDE